MLVHAHIGIIDRAKQVRRWWIIRKHPVNPTAPQPTDEKKDEEPVDDMVVAPAMTIMLLPKQNRP